MNDGRRISGKQYAMFSLFESYPRGLTVEDVGHYDQRTFGSWVRNGWAHWDGKRFIRSEAGERAIDTFTSADINRKVASLKLTSFFTPTAITLPRPKKKITRGQFVPTSKKNARFG